MAYTINLTDGTIFATIADGTINTSSSMILVGKNYAGYGEFLDENFIHLLENSSNNTAPGAPLTGQLWWDKANGLLKVYNGSVFKVVSGATSSQNAPTSSVAGDLWFDSTYGQLKVYSGTTWILVGPASISGQGVSGSVVETVRDNSSVDHVVIRFYVNDATVGIISKDATFTPQTAITGFTTISPGFQLSSSVPNALFRGTTTNAQTLDNITSDGFLSAISNDTTTGTLGILNDGGLTVGADGEGRISVTGSDVYIRNRQQDGNLFVQINDGGVVTSAISINGATGIVTIPTSLVVNGGITGTFTGNISGNFTAPGSNTQVTFNDAGLAGASAGLTFNKNTNALAVSGTTTVGNLAAGTGTITGGSLSITGTVTGGTITSTGAVTAAGTVTGGNISTTAGGTVTGTFLAAAGAITGGSLAVSNAITGGSVTVSGTGNIQGANIVATSRVVATGNIVTSGFFVGDGSQITNVSAGTSIANGTSNMAVIASGGNIRANVGGVSIISITSGGIVNNLGNGNGNIGSESSYFNRVFATSTSALYADVAERFAADEELAPGTVVELGGTAEITRSLEELSENVFGIISTQPAYLMNGGAGRDNTHPPVAMTGRVPVHVIGAIRKGDRLVSAGNGMARAAKPGESTAFNVIGRSLDDKQTTEQGFVEAIVTIK